MLAIRIHGLGGQGVVSMAEIIAITAFKKNLYSQAFPSFGPERIGAPVEAYVRIDDKEIRIREQIYNPDYVIILEDRLLNQPNLFSGLNKKTKVFINTKRSKEEIEKILKIKNIFYFNSEKVEILGNKKFINTSLIGFFAKKSNLFNDSLIEKVLKDYFEEKGSEIINKNLLALKIGYNY